MRYIYELENWPLFSWDKELVSNQLATVSHLQGRLLGKMESLGFSLQLEANLKVLTENIVKSSEIEGEMLDSDDVRSSIARHLGLDLAGLKPSNHYVDGVVEMMLDATQNYNKKLTKVRLFNWHAALFPTGQSGIHRIRVSQWRDDREGPMQVISGSMGKEQVHFQAPAASIVAKEMSQFLQWIESESVGNNILKAAISHLYFVTIHPFEDGNGRIARAITDMILAQPEHSKQRFYSISAQIRNERKVYYKILENTQKGHLDITSWLVWFLSCLERAILGSETIISDVLKKHSFWERYKTDEFNHRQRKVLNQIFDGFKSKITSSRWAKYCKCSQDTASRDIKDLLNRKILITNPGGGRSTSYSLAESEN